jgi:hypothetical protein
MGLASGSGNISLTNDQGAVVNQATSPGSAQTGNIHMAGDIRADGNIVSTNGNVNVSNGGVSATGDISSASGNISAISGYLVGNGVLVTGPVTSNTGDISTTSGNISAPAGNVDAASMSIGGNYLNTRPKNWLINGNFDVWQRGTSFSTVPSGVVIKYTADHWRFAIDGSGSTSSVSRSSFTPGQTAVPGEPTYYLTFNQTVAGSGGTLSLLDQPVEGVRNLAGQTVTLSFWAKADAARTLIINGLQSFGSGGSTGVALSNTNCNLTTSWQKFTVTIAVPSIAGKTIGTSGNDATFFRFNFPVNTVQTIDIAQVQVEVGSKASPFQKKSFEEEYRSCLRYYQKSFPYATAPVQNVGTTLGALRGMSVVAGAVFTFLFTYFQVPFWTTPTITLYNPLAANALARNSSQASDATATVTGGPTCDKALAIDVTGAAAWVAGAAVVIHWAAEAEF